MGKIYCMIGKSGAGKDTVFSSLMKRRIPALAPVVTYTTRPVRTGETDGVEYHFTDDAGLAELEAAGKVIEKRTYHTVHGDWHYFTCEIDISQNTDYIMIGTPDVVDKLYEHYSADDISVIWLDMDDGERLKRCINREAQQKNPNYSEVCRRFLADEADFRPERMEKYSGMRKVDSSVDIDIVVSETEHLIVTDRISH